MGCVRSLACILETATINTLQHFGINGTRKKASPGIWVDDRKIAALGLDVRKGINIHGVALNIHNGSDGFRSIEACGDASVAYTSVAQELQVHRCSLQTIGTIWLQSFIQTLSETAVNNSCN